MIVHHLLNGNELKDMILSAVLEFIVLFYLFPTILYVFSIIFYTSKREPKKTPHTLIGIGLFVIGLIHLHITLIIMYFNDFDLISAYFVPILYIPIPYVLLYLRSKVSSEQKQHIFSQYIAFSSLQALLSLLLLGGYLIESDLNNTVRIGVALLSAYVIIHFTYVFLKRFPLKSTKRD